MNDAWTYRKNLAHVGMHCSHGKWWSEDCSRCVEEKEGENRYS